MIVGRRPGTRGPQRGLLLAAGALMAVVPALVGACSNAQNTAASGGASAPGVTATSITVGSIADVTGYDSSDFSAISKGVQAYFDMVNAQGGVNGRKLELPAGNVLDDQGSPSTDTTVAQELVQQRHVFAIVGVATPFFGGAKFLAQQGTPTFGYVVSTDWDNAPNLFGNGGSYLNFAGAAPPLEWFAKAVGATSVGFVSYAVPQSNAACNAAAQGITASGGTVGFNDPNLLPGFDGTADVLQMKAHHVNVMISCLDGPGSLSMAKALAQNYPNAVTQLWLNGYDRSVIQSNASILNNTYFFVQHVPFEAPAQFPGKYPGMATYISEMNRYEPQYTYDEAALQGWVSASQFVTGLKAIGPKVTQQALIAAINKETAFNAGGIISPVNWTTAHGSANGVSCGAYVEAVGGITKVALAHKDEVMTCFASPGGEQVAPLPGTPGT